MPDIVQFKYGNTLKEKKNTKRNDRLTCKVKNQNLTYPPQITLNCKTYIHSMYYTKNIDL